jgi:hypothetical protein
MSGSPMSTRVRLSAERRAEIAAQRAETLRIREGARVVAREDRRQVRVRERRRRVAQGHVVQAERRHQAPRTSGARVVSRGGIRPAAVQPAAVELSAVVPSAVDRIDDAAARAEALRAESGAPPAVRERAEAIVQRADAAIAAAEEAEAAPPPLSSIEEEVAALERDADRALEARLQRIAVAKAIMKGLPSELTARGDTLRETSDGLRFDVSTPAGRLGVAIEGEGDDTRVVLDVAEAKLDGARKVDGQFVSGCAAEEAVGQEIFDVASTHGVEHGRIEREGGRRFSRGRSAQAHAAERR